MLGENENVGQCGVTKIRTNKWQTCLENGEKWEEKLLEKISNVLQVLSVKRIDYFINPELQKQGFDGYVFCKEPKIEIKTRKYSAYKYKDILLETKSIIERNIPGWFYTTKADIVAYVWENDSRTNLIDGYLIFMSTKLREWFENNKQKFKVKIAKSESLGETWKTENYAIPINMFPKGTIYRFNPNLDLGKQSKIDRLLW